MTKATTYDPQQGRLVEVEVLSDTFKKNQGPFMGLEFVVTVKLPDGTIIDQPEEFIWSDRNKRNSGW